MIRGGQIELSDLNILIVIFVLKKIYTHIVKTNLDPDIHFRIHSTTMGQSGHLPMNLVYDFARRQKLKMLWAHHST